MTDKVLDVVEGGYDALGMMRGENGELKRFVFTAGVAYGLVYAAQPSALYLPNGEARPWSAVTDDPNSTTFPHWMVPVVAGFIGGFLI